MSTANKLIILRAARELIASEEEQYICLAVLLCRDVDWIAAADIRLEVVKGIPGASKLGRPHTLVSWLAETQSLDRGFANSHAQQARLAWLDKMIYDLEQA